MKETVWWVRFLSIGLLVVLVGFSPAWATPSANPLTKMEQQLFARTYPSDPEADRLERLENAVFGTPKTNEPTPNRIQALSQFFQFPTQAPPSSQTPQTHKRPEITEYNPPAVQPGVAPNESPYPVVSTMEQRVLGKAFEQDTLEHRLARLERQTLGQVQLGTLQERTDQLRLMVLGDTGNSNTVYPPASGQAVASASPLVSPVQSGSSQPALSNTGNTSDLLQAVAPLEKKVLHQTFPYDSLDARLTRLEMKVFNQAAPELSAEDRLYRIVGVLNAQSSSRQEQAFRRGGPATSGGLYYGGPYPRSTMSSGMGTFGSMLLMILMGLL